MNYLMQPLLYVFIHVEIFSTALFNWVIFHITNELSSYLFDRLIGLFIINRSIETRGSHGG